MSIKIGDAREREKVLTWPECGSKEAKIENRK